jgi:hypothetical protein
MADPILSPSARYVYETGLEVTPQQDLVRVLTKKKSLRLAFPRSSGRRGN